MKFGESETIKRKYLKLNNNIKKISEISHVKLVSSLAA